MAELTPAPRPQLRAELVFHPGEDGDFVLEDAVRSRFYRIGPRERALIERLDGSRSAAQALAHANAALDEPLAADEAMEVMRFLDREGLLRAAGEAAQRRSQALHGYRRIGAGIRWLNALFVRVPLVNPDRLLDRLLPYARPLLGPVALGVAILLWLSGAWLVLADGPRLQEALRGVLYPGDWAWFLAIWIAVKVLHELAHGLVSKRYGGEVYEAGVLFVLFVPVGYVDATPSWRFASRWQRIHTAAAGMIAELTCAAIAAWVWAYAPEGPVRDLAFKTVLVAGVATLIVNANPLMRFDGYFVLSDLVGIPNLYAKGRAWIAHVGRRWLLGRADSWRPGLPPAKAAFVRAYGMASLVWRWTVIVALLIAATGLFDGLGWVLAATTVIAMIAMPAWRAWRVWRAATPAERPAWRTAAPRVVALAAIALVLATQLRWQPSVAVPAMVDWRDAAVIRAQTPGHVTAVFVQPGQAVAEGDPLLKLENPALAAERAAAAAELAKAEIGERVLLNRNAQAGLQAQAKRVDALRAKVDELSRREDELVIRAPRAGQVIGRGLDAFVGTYLTAGAEVMTIAADDGKALRMAIAEDIFARLAMADGERIEARFEARPLRAYAGTVERVTPRATARLEHPALAAAYGGPIAVRPRGPDDAGAVKRDNEPYEALAPYVTVAGVLDAGDARGLYVGEIGTVSLREVRQSAAEQAYRSVRGWIDGLIRARDASVAT
jgi:putative peptide zinc metalloprotease protein